MRPRCSAPRRRCAPMRRRAACRPPRPAAPRCRRWTRSCSQPERASAGARARRAPRRRRDRPSRRARRRPTRAAAHAREARPARNGAAPRHRRDADPPGQGRHRALGAARRRGAPRRQCRARRRHGDEPRRRAGARPRRGGADRGAARYAAGAREAAQGRARRADRGGVRGASRIRRERRRGRPRRAAATWRRRGSRRRARCWPHLVPGGGAAPLAIAALPDVGDGVPGGSLYVPAAIDGSRGATLWLDTRSVHALPTPGVSPIAYHLGIPGQHLQASRASTDRPTLARMRRWPAFTEGWACYGERLAAEQGLFARDPWGDVARLSDELLRAARLVVDIGIHAQHWPRQQAEAEMNDMTGGIQAAAIDRIVALARRGGERRRSACTACSRCATPPRRASISTRRRFMPACSIRGRGRSRWWRRRWREAGASQGLARALPFRTERSRSAWCRRGVRGMSVDFAQDDRSGGSAEARGPLSQRRRQPPPAGMRRRDQVVRSVARARIREQREAGRARSRHPRQRHAGLRRQRRDDIPDHRLQCACGRLEIITSGERRGQRLPRRQRPAVDPVPTLRTPARSAPRRAD